jgi:hypothetical protein
MLSQSAALSCSTVGNGFFMPMGLHPPWIYPVRGSSSFCGSMTMLFSPTALAAFFRSSSSATGITKT